MDHLSDNLQQKRCENIIVNGIFKKIENDYSCNGTGKNKKKPDNYVALTNDKNKSKIHDCNLVKYNENLSSLTENHCCNNNSQCKPDKHQKPGNFVPIIDNHIDLASSTYVNNPIIPSSKPADNVLKNKKYQVIIDFNKDINGEIWPEWMKKPVLHALGMVDVSSQISTYVDQQVMPLINNLDSKIISVDTKVEKINTEILSNLLPLIHSIDNKTNTISILVNQKIIPSIASVDNKVTNLISNVNILSSNVNVLSNNFEEFKTTPATLSNLGLVRSSDKINQISVLLNGIMEINGVTLSKISQDCELIIYDRPIEESIF